MSTSLPSSLQALEDLWHQAGVPVEEHFATGLDSAIVESVLQGAGLPAPAEIIEWFGWHNGAGDPRKSGSPLGPTNWTALSLTEALSARTFRLREADEAAEEDEGLTLPSHWWDDAWLPIADDGGQGVLTAALYAGRDAVAVRYVIWSDSEFRSVREESLRELLHVWIGILQGGGWTWSESLKVWEGDYTALPVDLRRRSLM